MKFLKCFGCLGITLLIAGFFFILINSRTRSTDIKEIAVAKNIVIPVELMHSQKRYFGGHGFGFGGGNVKNQVEFYYNQIKYLHNTPYILEVIKLYKNHFYLIYYDRVSDRNEITFRFYKSTKEGGFDEIKATQFPKHLAIQNRFWTGYNKPEDLVGLIPEKLKGTKTVSYWHIIEDEPQDWDTRVEFIKDYKEKYITNRKEQE